MPEYTQAEHALMAIECLKVLRSQQIFSHSFKLWERRFWIHVSGSGLTVESFGTSNAEICKLRIQWHQKRAAEILYMLRYEANKPEELYKLHDMTGSIGRLRYHLQEGRITLKWLGSSEELITMVIHKYHRQQAEEYLGKLRQTQNNLLLFADYLNHLNSEIAAAETTLERLESSEEELMELRLEQLFQN